MDQIARGRELVERGEYQNDKMLDGLAVCEYLKSERQRVAERGECSGRCGKTEQIEHYATGKLVCPRTLQPCEQRRLAALVKLYGRKD